MHEIILNGIDVKDEVFEHHAVMSQRKSLVKVREFIELTTPQNEVRHEMITFPNFHSFNRCSSDF